MKILKDKFFWAILAVIFLTLLSTSYFNGGAAYLLAAFAFLFLIIFFWFYPQIGLYSVIFLYPFNYWEFIYGSINVPYVDLLALILFVSWLSKSVYLAIAKKQKFNLKNFPGWIFMLFFVLASILSLASVERDLFWQSAKYILRPIIFFYLMFIILPFNIIDNFKKLHNALKVMFAVGLAISLVGAWSMIFPPFVGIRTAVPVSIFGFWPLGTNHNSLAEALVCLIPAAFVLFWYEKDLLLKNIYFIGGFLMIIINFLTLSRSGWLAFLLELFVLIVFKYRESVRRFFTNYLFYLILVLMAPILYLMYELITSNIAVSSNLSRFKLIEIALYMFKQHPLFGAGAGMFVPFVDKTVWYIVEYGNSLDAHGFVFKTLAETGIFGTVSFLALLGFILYKLYTAYKKYKKTNYVWLILAMLALAVGDIFFQLFSTDYYLARFWLPLGIALAVAKLCDQNLNKTLWQKK